MLVSPHKELMLTVTSGIGGKWNRLIAGHLIALDEWGGFTVNPAIPLGSGRVERSRVLTPNLDFVGKRNTTTFLSQAAPGWRMSWKVSPGERLGISTFPPRPFDWKKSFETQTTLTFPDASPSEYPKLKAFTDVLVLWNFTVRGYGMTFGPRVQPNDEAMMREHIRAIHAAGMRATTYFSPYFYYSRDPQEFVDEAARLKKNYGIDGLYMDGLPDLEWLVAYEQMRMLRELFPDGELMLHTTGQVYNGGPPLALPDIFLPFVDTYATVTLRGEYIANKDRAWPYPRYVTSQFRRANTIGMQKGDRWDVPQREQDALNLLFNGRTWAVDASVKLDERAYMRDDYHPKLMILKKLWQEKGHFPDFYEKHYLPKAEELTGLKLPRQAGGSPVAAQANDPLKP
jgi:hypothetical protein